MAVEVRKAAPEDIDWLLGQLREFDAFIARKRSFFEDETFARATVSDLVAGHVVLIAHEAGERQGIIAGILGAHPFNHTIRVLTEAFWWVGPAHRGAGAGAALLDAFEKVGRETADWINFSLDHNSPVRERHLTKRGFQLVERSFLLEV
jgi:RimJ/RimL family protein N-acetyltransferase